MGSVPHVIAVHPNGTRVYVANAGSNNVSVIDTATNTEILPRIGVGFAPAALGQFIVTVHKATLCGYLGMFSMGYYSFRAEKGEDVTVTMTKDTQGTSRGNQASLSVYTCNFSFFRQDMGALPNEVAAAMPYAGIYALKATNKFSFRDRFIGDYCITVISSSNAYKNFSRGIPLR